MRQDGRFELTAKKGLYWHRARGPGCCRSLSDIGRNHLTPAGFAWHFGSGGNYLMVSGPGLAEDEAGPLYEAVSGLETASS
jgi:hypothetical protein